MRHTIKQLIHLSYLTILFLLYNAGNPTSAQELTQTIRGRIVDKVTQSPLPGAAIAAIKDSTVLVGASADKDGYFHLENVPVGRQTFKVFFVGYMPLTLMDIIVSSGKELVLN